MPEQNQPLDDVMLAMDVVDTLRHRAQLVDRELSATDRRNDLLTRLKEIYSAQGIDVPEHILEDGVKALEERRFTYDPPEASLSVKLAHIYVSRGQWGKPVIGGLAAIGFCVGGYQGLVAGPRKTEAAAISRALEVTLPAELASLASEVTDLAVTERGDMLAAAYLQNGNVALREKDVAAVQASLSGLKTLRGDLLAVYDVRIRYRNNAESGFFRTHPSIPGQQNYYLVVEAVDARGEVLTVPVSSEEVSDMQRVDKWAQRVSRAAFEAAVADKQDDTIIQNDLIGHKLRGHLTPEYRVETPGGAILEW